MSVIHSMPGHLIRRLQQISTSVFADHMKSKGIDLTSPQFAALSVLKEYPDIDQATLAGLIAHDRPTIGGVVDRLVAKGLVARQTNPADRRARMLQLTDAGSAMIERLAPIVGAFQNEILPGLTEEERKEFVRLASKVALAGNELSRAPMHLPRKKKQNKA